MNISEVRIKLMDAPGDRLSAFCSITIDDCFVIRDLKIIEGTKGTFVAMPSRKLSDKCPNCHHKNHLRANHCNNCGVRLPHERASKQDGGRAKLYADIAHPINSACRDDIQQKVIAAFEEEVIRSQQEGYICTYDEYDEDKYAMADDDQDDSSERLQQSYQEQQRSGHAKMTLETEDGKVHRVDSESRHESNQNQKAAENKSVPQHRDSFGDGII